MKNKSKMLNPEQPVETGTSGNASRERLSDSVGGPSKKGEVVSLNHGRVSITRTGDSGCKASLSFAFDPEEIGPERTKQIWEGVARIISGILEEAEIPEFLRQWEEAIRK